MNIEVDQFGRNTNQSNINNNNEDKNKKILESLSEIKEQLQNKNFSPISDPPVNLSSKISKNSDFEELNQRLINLERSLIDINEKLKTKGENFQDINSNLKNFNEEKSIFNNLEKSSSKNLLVLDTDKDLYVTKFKFYHFIITFAGMSGLLIYLTSIQLGMPINQIIKIILNIFN
ncbi:MAG: hypothetical protein EVA57_04865 [alpha proteobacterium HIMB59]|nr:MAG: hypothetical protein EVA57_04865 [alpha proteobacterium HIMB59]